MADLHSAAPSAPCSRCNSEQYAPMVAKDVRAAPRPPDRERSMGGNTDDPLWSQAFESQSRYENLVEGHVPGRAYDVRLHRTRWTEPGAGVFNPSLCFIKMHLSPVALTMGGYRSNCSHPLRDVIFVPQGEQLHIYWEQGVDRG